MYFKYLSLLSFLFFIISTSHAQRHGLVIDSVTTTGSNGIQLEYAVNTGIRIKSSEGGGMFIESAGGDGIRINNAEQDGVSIDQAKIGLRISQTQRELCCRS